MSAIAALPSQPKTSETPSLYDIGSATIQLVFAGEQVPITIVTAPSPKDEGF
jgi:hypothetical protein